MRLLRAGDFDGARAVLRSVVEESDDPDDRLLLGRLAYVATSFGEAKEQLERAFRGFQAAGIPRRAAMAAAALGALHADGLQ